MKHTDKLVVLFNKINTTNKEIIKITYSRYYEEILLVLIKEGIIRSISHDKDNNELTIFLNINKDMKMKWVRISKPGKRVYLNNKEISKLDLDFYLISTSQGIMSNQQSILHNIGGEVLIKMNYEHTNK